MASNYFVLHTCSLFLFLVFYYLFSFFSFFSLIHSACYLFLKSHFFLSDVTVVLCLKIPQKDAGIATSSRTGTQFACCSVRSVLSSNTMETELRMNKLKTPVPIIAGLCVYLYCKIYHTVNRLRSFLSSCHPVILSFCHSVILSSCHPVILSSCPLVNFNLF